MTTAAQAAAIPTLQQYIANLSAVRAPTPQQQAELTLYKSRLAAYTGGGTPTPPVATAPTGGYTPLGTPSTVGTIVGDPAAVAAAKASGSNMTLADWYVYQLSQGVAVGPTSYYGSMANAAQQSEQQAAYAAGLARFQSGERYAPTPGYLQGGNAGTPSDLALYGAGAGSRYVGVNPGGALLPEQALAAAQYAALTGQAPAGGSAASLLPGAYNPSLLTPQGTGTVNATAPLQTGVAGGVTVAGTPPGAVSASSSDAGSPAIGGPFPQLSGSLGGLPILDILLVGGGALAIVYLAGHRKGKGKSTAKG